jgi:prepilin-type N-terminal cleavage/methylation domain-containing protein
MSVGYYQQQVFLGMMLSKKGFTLIELVIFIVIGAIVLPASFVAFTAAIKHFSTPDYYVKARFFAEQKMEELTSNPYCCVCLNYTSLTCPSACPASSSSCTIESNDSVWRDTPETGFIRTWEICYVTSGAIDPNGCSSSETDYKRIRVGITPPSGPDYVVKTIVTKRPKS